MPTVSVVIPTFNRLAYLKEAVDSVRAQTFDNWELIVVDDGSDDGSAEWLESLSDARVAVIREPHTGNKSRLRNRGARRGTAAWIAFLDSDDLWRPEKLSRQLAALAANPGRRWSCTGVSFVDGNGEEIPQRSGPPYRAQSGWILEPLLLFTASATMPTLMVHRTLFEEIGGFDEQILWREDYELELRLATHAEIHALSESLTAVRHHAGRISSSRPAADLHLASAVVFRKTAANATNGRIRAICRQQCAAQLATRARLLSRNGQHASAIASSFGAIREAPFTRDAWRAFASSALRVLTAPPRRRQQASHTPREVDCQSRRR